MVKEVALLVYLKALLGDEVGLEPEASQDEKIIPTRTAETAI